MALSVIVITHNEADAIRDCLASVEWADEIVVVDSGSSDATVAICREFTDKVVVRQWPGFGPQKNYALSLASGEWVLSIDADERVPAELRAHIEAALRNPAGRHAFRVPRLSSFCGCFMQHGGWRPDYVTRLFLRGRARFSDDLVHERLIVDGEIGTLPHSLLHLSYVDLEEVLDKLNRYSTSGAEMLARRGENSSLLRAILHGGWAFLRTYFLRAGFLDGREGFMLAVTNAETTYYRYLKLMLLAAGKR
ncbi:MAG: glycosyltransferase family 2 protein [Burkholderiales bacterium]|nr:glycosyltransferase family 2 protein [Burkholderiales bacterium]